MAPYKMDLGEGQGGWGEGTETEELAGWEMCLKSRLGSFPDGQGGTNERNRKGSV